MKTDAILRKLQRENKEFTTSDELRALCRSLGIDYGSAIRHLVPRGHLVKVFRGLFYIKSPEEATLGRSKYDHLELVARGLKHRGIDHWYYGLSTALVLNNMTHERFSVEYVMNTCIQRNRPTKVAGHEFVYKKLKPSLFSFGVVHGRVNHSDPEKTILDLVYIDRYGGVPPERTALNVSEYMDTVDTNKLTKYAANYPSTISRFLEERLLER